MTRGKGFDGWRQPNTVIVDPVPLSSQCCLDLLSLSFLRTNPRFRGFSALPRATLQFPQVRPALFSFPEQIISISQATPPNAAFRRLYGHPT
jgi:hypothetical protein